MQSLDYLLVLGIVVCILGFYNAYVYYTSSKSLKEQLINYNMTNRALKKTLLKGLIYRFNTEEGEESPLDFEKFVSDLFQNYYGGNAIVTEESGDGGIDIEHYKGENLYLGQVKCYQAENKVDFNPIAIIHSQMIKKKAKGGFIVTTSEFSENAKRYASNLNIDLIEGDDLVNIWLKSMEESKEQAVDTIPLET
ncbi:restriction endonuclease [Natranaerobius thermophilus]|uniref:Restriction endonuclease n=1 Tax=Natranaerobius thermophilus (strain ATCC BAA-1301 / DSM 18059 / JW/NM-WN-LF) TaxID=457570 RepID=B2A434_NATTJ|nr:restriction endonuclease [Natranaerobius thermophilus]ACB85136.1 restriction endonuclease [Natranaerobius thermophilus JW/NM-WN-LF]